VCITFPFSHYTFPERGLLDSLVDIYFQRVGVFWPLLHRHSFTVSISEGLHYFDSDFAKIVLLVSAIGSRWSDNVRVLPPGYTSLWHWAGWKWYSQVKFEKRSQLSKPTLFDLQYCFVSYLLRHRCSLCLSGVFHALAVSLVYLSAAEFGGKLDDCRYRTATGPRYRYPSKKGQDNTANN
jgi:hypothetical protein